jgi:hypothetical protein
VHRAQDGKDAVAQPQRGLEEALPASSRTLLWLDRALDERRPVRHHRERV